MTRGHSRPTLASALAVIVVRDGELPIGADETVAEAGGAVLVAGRGLARRPTSWERPARCGCSSALGRPGALGGTLAPVLAGVDMVLLPASPDGRDLAPRLAVTLGRPLLAGAVRCAPGGSR